MTFIFKLFDLTNRPSSSEHIQWSTDGSRFTVINTVNFAKDVLPQYFKHNNFASFLRQLNVYGFKRLSTPSRAEYDTDTVQPPPKLDLSESFQHQFFVRGMLHLLTQIQRRQPFRESNSFRNADARYRGRERDYDSDEDNDSTTTDPRRRIPSFQSKRQFADHGITVKQEPKEVTVSPMSSADVLLMTLEARCSSLETTCHSLQASLAHQIQQNQANTAALQGQEGILRSVMNTMTDLAGAIALSSRVAHLLPIKVPTRPPVLAAIPVYFSPMIPLWSATSILQGPKGEGVQPGSALLPTPPSALLSCFAFNSLEPRYEASLAVLKKPVIVIQLHSPSTPTSA